MKPMILLLSPLLLAIELAWIFLPRGRRAGQKSEKTISVIARLRKEPRRSVFSPNETDSHTKKRCG